MNYSLMDQMEYGDFCQTPVLLSTMFGDGSQRQLYERYYALTAEHSIEEEATYDYLTDDEAYEIVPQTLPIYSKTFVPILEFREKKQREPALCVGCFYGLYRLTKYLTGKSNPSPIDYSASDAYSWTNTYVTGSTSMERRATEIRAKIQ